MIVAAAVLVPHRRVVIPVVVVTAGASMALMAREADTLSPSLPSDLVGVAGRVVGDTSAHGFPVAPNAYLSGGSWHPWPGGPRLWVRTSGDIEAGQQVVVRGRIVDGGFRTRHGPVGASVVGSEVEVVGRPPMWMRPGSALRRRVRTVFAEQGPGPALVSGFLIGDTANVPDSDIEALRRSGLSHFVAVSGSNVALVVGAWWILSGVFIRDGRLRSVLALAVIVVFVVATRWEPSVVRASVMAGIVLGTRSIGRSVSTWSAFAAAVPAILVVAPELVASVGFQLSVAATFGVIASQGGRRGWLGMTLAATVGAQLAVAPLLLHHFGSVPLLSPLANVVAAPLVTAATVVGGAAAVTGVPPLVSLAGFLADLVTVVATAFAAGPQLDLVGASATLAVVGTIVVRPTRLIGIAAASALAVAVLTPAPAPIGPELVVLDVGQGDALLLRGGATILIDGGPDAALLRSRLNSYRVERLDLVIVTHPHADHITGAMAAIDDFAVGGVWFPSYTTDPALDRLIDVAARREVPAQAVRAGMAAQVGPYRLEVLGPRRRYASLNDGSVVVAISAGGPRLLAAGDVEEIAQRELDPGRVDILKVPHQGAATSSVSWLSANSGATAVISVGPNSFGHPSPEVIAALRAAGATVLRTDTSGDVRVSLAPLPLP